MPNESITVLFVDDDEQWARYMADGLEAEDAAFTVQVARNVNEAVVVLDDGDRAIDCVVTDFRMPEVDGIQLIERFQESHPDLPVILITGDGSEDVAARAINAGVTDYLRKDSRVDQTPLLATRIRQAVERAELRAEIRASEQRYRTVVEHTRDAIVVVRDEEIVFANDRFAALCGANAEPESRRAFRFVVHEDDRDVVAELISSVHSGSDPELREVRLRRPSGEVRHCEILGDAVTYENEAATLLSIRDVTRRRSREGALKRERALNRAVQELLVGVETRTELESGFVDVLAAYGYDLAWIGALDNRGVHTHATAGDDEYPDGLEDGALGDDHGGDPSLWSARTGTAQYVPDFEALMPTTRRDDALEAGLRAGYALPLRYEGISYGTLGVYTTEPSGIDEADRSRLAEVAETVSFAIHHLETRQTLTSSERVVVEVSVESDAYYLPSLLSERLDNPVAEITVNGTHLIDGETQVQYISVPTEVSESLTDAFDDHSSVRRSTVIDSSDPTRVRVTVAEETPEAHLRAVGALVRSTTVTPDGATISFELASRTYLRSVLDRLNEQYASVTIHSVIRTAGSRTGDRSVRLDLDTLTEKQLFALESAYHHGYFDRPRRHSAVDIAESLEITHTTFLQHLRVAEEKLFGQLFGESYAATDR